MLRVSSLNDKTLPKGMSLFLCWRLSSKGKREMLSAAFASPR